MSSKYLNALATVQATNKRLGALVLVVAALGAVGMYFAARTPHRIDVNLHPNIQGGDVVTVTDGQSPVPDVNVYGFAYYIWQQLNRWQADGIKDYGEQIFRFQAYLTPSCRAQLQADMQQRSDAGELRFRTRQMSEIPGFGYASNRVITDGRSAWTVLLDMQLMEAFRGQAIKDAFIRYPIRVVKYDVDRERNPWRLAIDCYGSHRPQRLDMRDVQAITQGKAEVQLPGALTPAALPRTTGEAVDPNAAPNPVPVQQSAPAPTASAASSAKP